MKKRIVKRNTNTYLNLTPFHSGRKLASGGGFENAVTDMPGGSDASDMASAYAGNASVSSAVKYTGKMLDAAAQNLKLASTYNIQAGIADNMSLAYSNQNLNTNDDLMQAWEQYDPLSHIRFKDVRGGNTLTRLHNSQMSELRGAEAGYSASGGAWQGAVIGGVVGKIAGNLAWTIGDAKARRLKRKLNREIDQSNAIGYDLLSEQTSDVAQKNLWRAEDNIVAEGGDLNTGLDKKFAGNAMQTIYNNGTQSGVRRYNTGGELLTFPSSKTDEGIFIFKDTPTQEQIQVRNNHPALFNKYAFEDTSTPEKTNKYTGGGNIILGPTQQENTYHSPLETLLPFIMKAQQMRQQQEERDARNKALEERLNRERGIQAALATYKKLSEEAELKKAEETVEIPAQEVIKPSGPSEELYKSIMKFEGFSPRPTPDAKGLAIGYGDHNKNLIDYYIAHPDEQYTEEQGVGLIKDTMTGIWKILSENIPGWEELTPAQQDGIADAAYNSGPYAILNSKGLMEGLRNKDWNKVVRNLNRGWNQVDDKGRPLRGLRKRRNYNRLPFLYPEMTTYGVLPDGTVVNPDDLLNVDLSKPYVFENGIWKNTIEGKEDKNGTVPVFVSTFAEGGSLGNPPTKRRSERTTREKHMAEIQALSKKYPELYGIKTSEFLPWLNETAFKESTFDRYNGNEKYVGYYALPKEWFKTEEDWSSEAQFKNAFRHLKEIFHDKITKEDLIKARELGFTPAQMLFKYWNQGNRANRFIYTGQEGRDGNKTKISQWGNDYNPNDPLDYSIYLQNARTAPYYVLQKGDSYYTAARNARNPYLNYTDTNYGIHSFPYNKKYPARHVGDTVALVDASVPEFRKIVKEYDEANASKKSILPDYFGTKEGAQSIWGNRYIWTDPSTYKLDKEPASLAPNPKHKLEYFADGGNLFKKGGKTKDPKKDYAYINNELTPWVYNNLKEFWGPQSSEVRQWLRKNYPEQLNEYYENTPEDIRRTIPNKYLTKEQQAQRGKKAASSAINDFGKDYVPLIVTSPMLGEGLVTAPLATVGGIAGGIAGDYGGRKLDEKLGFENPTFQIIGGLLGGAVGGGLGNKATSLYRLYREGNKTLPINDESFYRLVNKEGYEDAINSGVIRNKEGYNGGWFQKGQIYGNPKKGEVIIKTKGNNDVAFGKIGTHGVEDKYNYSPKIKTGEAGTPVLDFSGDLTSIEPVPYTPRADEFNFYKKLPKYRIPGTTRYVDFGYKKLNPTFNNSYGNLKFFRNLGEVPEVVNNEVKLTTGNSVVHNFTTDLPFRRHSGYSNTYPHVLAVEPEALHGKIPMNGDPMDTFFLNSSAMTAPKNNTIFISGSREALKAAKKQGIKTLTSRKLQKEYSKILKKRYDNGKGPVTVPQNFELYDNGEAYRTELDKLITNKLGRPTLRDYQFFSGTTRTPMTVEPNIGQFEDYLKIKEGKMPSNLVEEFNTSYPVYKDKEGFKLKEKRTKIGKNHYYKYIYNNPFENVYYDLTPETESILVPNLRLRDLSHIDKEVIEKHIGKQLGKTRRPIR